MIKHLGESTNTVKSNRLMMVVWVLCPLVYLLVSLLSGGIFIENGKLHIHGTTFFYMLLMVLVISLASLAASLVRLLRRRKVAGGASVKELVGRSDVLRLSASLIFFAAAVLALWFLL